MLPTKLTRAARWGSLALSANVPGAGGDAMEVTLMVSFPRFMLVDLCLLAANGVGAACRPVLLAA
jgi:hypothetical protein